MGNFSWAGVDAFAAARAFSESTVTALVSLFALKALNGQALTHG